MLTAEATIARAHALVHAHAKARKKVLGIPLPAVIAIVPADLVVACEARGSGLL